MSELLKGLNDSQKEAVTTIDGTVQVVASAGSGKTKVLTSRIGYMVEQGINPSTILCSTFTKKASKEMEERLKSLIPINDLERINLGTLHSFGYKILSREYTEMGDPLAKAFKNPLLINYESKKFINELKKEVKNNISLDKGTRNLIEKEYTPKLLSMIGYNKNQKVSPSQYLDAVRDTSDEYLGIFYKLYEEKKQHEKRIDVGDLIYKLHDLFLEHPAILRKYQNFYKYILMDEHQDTGILQNEIVKMLAHPQYNLFVVGDSKQSIFSFNGARPDLFLNIRNEYKDTTLIHMRENYRSLPDIVHKADQLMSPYFSPVDKTAIPVRESNENCVFFNKYIDEEDEAENIVETIKDFNSQGEDYKDFFVLYRTNAQSHAIEDMLIKNSIPYITSSYPFYERREVKHILSYMRLALNRHDDVAFREVYNTPNRYLGKVFLEKLKSCKDSHFDAIAKDRLHLKQYQIRNANEFLDHIVMLEKLLKTKTPLEVLDYIMKNVGYESYLKEEGLGDEDSNKLDNIDTLKHTMSKFDNVEDFIEHVKEMTSKIKRSRNGVHLLSIHKSKGLQAKRVFVIGVNDDLLPHYRAKESGTEDEERRLMYVAITRAEDKCYISSTHCYNGNGYETSKYVEDINLINK